MFGALLQTEAIARTSQDLSDWERREKELKALAHFENNPQFQIQSIEFKGLRRIELSAVLEKVQQRKGKPFDPQAVRQDIRALSVMGYFEKISVDLQEPSSVDPFSLKLVYTVVEKPAISQIDIVHDDALSLKDLQEVIQVKLWSILDLAKIQEDVRLLQKYYEDKGFFLAKVHYELLPGNTQKPTSLKPSKGLIDPKEEVKLVYRIQAYDKVQVKKVQFLNNRHFSDQKLKSLFREVHEGSVFSSGSFKETALKQDLQMLLYWYLDNGYLKFRHENPEVSLSEDKSWLYLSLYLEEGEAYRMGDIKLSGDLLLPPVELLEGLTQKTGNLFRISERNKDILYLTEKYQDLGYAFVNVIPKVVIHDDSRTVDVDYEFEKGNLVYLREISIRGNHKTYDEVIRRELEIHEGELFHGTRKRKSQENVERLGYFAPGEIQFNVVPVVGRTDLADIEIVVKERSTGSVNFGLGYGSAQRFFINGQVADTNFLGRGQILNFGGQFSGQQSAKSIQLSFTEPYTFDTRWTTGGSIYYTVLPFMQRYDNTRFGFDVKLGHPIAEYTSAYMTYKLERIKDLNIRPAARLSDVAADVGLLSSIIFSVTRDQRNNRYETSEGNFQSASVETAGLGGDFRFLKWVFDTRFYHKLVGDLVFRQKAEVGQMLSLSSRRDTPPSQRFYLGGANSLRGYTVTSLSPYYLDHEGTVQVIGGVYEAFSMSEIEYPLLREINLKIATFFDIGNAWSPGQKMVMQADVGFGLRIFMPMLGPLRFEWGFALNPRPGIDDTSAFQFMMGPPF